MDHKETGCQAHPEGPILCENNCGFFGSAATMNMCSKCHKDMMLKQEQAKLAASSIGSIVNGTSSSNGNEPVVAAASVNVQARPVEPKTISSQPLFSFGSGENGDTRSFSFGSGENGDTKSFSFGSGEIGDTKSFSFGSGASGEPFSFGLGGLVENADPKTFTFGSGENGEPKPEGPKRCVACNKRVGLTGFNCRCGHLFCAVHRYSDKHDCSYDYRTAARDAIAKANPVVKAEKIEKI